MQIQENIALAPYSTMRTGGPARFFAEVTSKEDFAEAIAFARARKLPVIIIGGGSNILIPDEGIEGLVMRNSIQGCSVEKQRDSKQATRVHAGSGEEWDSFVQKTITEGLSGLENLSYIPGTVGAAPVQNIGAYGVEVCDVIEEVEVFDTQQETFLKLSKAECQFAYRDSIFKTKPEWIIVGVTFCLSQNFMPNISYKDVQEYFGEGVAQSAQDVRDAVIKIRQNKLPDWHDVGTVGSFFTNPTISREAYQALQQKYPGMPGFDVGDQIKIPLAWVLDHVLHLKGYREGSVGLYETQPLALVNYGGATTTEILTFADTIAKKVCDVIGITPEREVRMLKRTR